MATERKSHSNSTGRPTPETLDPLAKRGELTAYFTDQITKMCKGFVLAVKGGLKLNRKEPHA